ncbi:MAG: energy transducer TonB [Chromatiales bacterium]|nr:energy transducer TonB [Chromatiales bacterium]
MISTQNQTDMLGIGLFVATALHAFVILGITFKPFDPSKPEYQQQSLEVMVVRQPKEQPEEDEQADYLAQVAQSGGGEKREREKPQIPEPPAMPPAAQAPAALQQPVDQVQPLTSEQSEQKAPVDSHIVEQQPLPTASQLLNSKNVEIARLTAELERKTEAYAKLPKRKAISASTKEYKYASYLDAWRRKVERIGNLNYPDQAKRDRLYGNLVLHVAVKADGSVDQIRVLHSSGHKILDDSAIRIVRLAAPFSPFPNEIRKETDILDITRTWQFLRSGKLNAE